MPIVHKLHWDRQEIVNDTGAAIANRAEYPSIFTGIAEKVIAIQIVQTDADGDLIDYTGLASSATCNFRVDSDYLNGVGSVGATDWTLSTGAEYKKEIGSTPGLVYINSILGVAGTIGSLAAGEWAFSGRYLYVRLDDSTNPTAKPDNYVQISFGTAAGTPPYIQAESTAWNLAGTWPVYNATTNAWTYTDPDITEGQITFTIAANTFDYIARIGSVAQQDCHGQIGIFGTGDDSNYITFFNQFNCINVINPEEPPVIVPSPYLTVTLGDARYVRFGDSGKYTATILWSALDASDEITIAHGLNTLTPDVELIQEDGWNAGTVSFYPVDATNVKISFQNWNPFTSITAIIGGGGYPAPDSIPLTEKGAASGVATLGADSLLPDAQAPEIAVKHMGNWDAGTNTPTLSDATGGKGELYRVSYGGTVDLGSGSTVYTAGETITHDGTDFGKTTRAIGETETTAYRGDRGKIAYDHSLIVIDNPHEVDASDVLIDDTEGYFPSDNVEDAIESLAKGVRRTTRVTTTYTILVTDREIFCDTDGGDFTVTLPALADGQSKRIINTGSGTLTVAPDGTDTIDGVAASKTMGNGSVILTGETTEGWW